MIACMHELLLSDRVKLDLSKDELINAVKNGNFEKVKTLVLSELDELKEWTNGECKEFIDLELNKFEYHMTLALEVAARCGHLAVVKFLSSLLNASATLGVFEVAITNGDVTCVQTLMGLDIVKQDIYQSTRKNSGADYYDAVMGAAAKGDINIVRELLKNDSIRELVYTYASGNTIPGKRMLQSETLIKKIAHGLRSIFSSPKIAFGADIQCKMIIDSLRSNYPQLDNVLERKENHIRALTTLYCLTLRSTLSLDPLFLITKMLLPAKDLNFTKKGKTVSVTDENIRHFVQTTRAVLFKRS